MKKQNRECQILRQQISEMRDFLRPYQAISYKVSEVSKLYDVYGDDEGELTRALNSYGNLINDVLDYTQTLEKRLEERGMK